MFSETVKSQRTKKFTFFFFNFVFTFGMYSSQLVSLSVKQHHKYGTNESKIQMVTYTYPTLDLH